MKARCRESSNGVPTMALARPFVIRLRRA
jgi:hypothetical protein